MNTYFGAILLAILPFISVSQTSISGTVNHYSKVTDIDYCEGKLTVTGATFFNVGDQVILIQIKGAAINTSNAASFGNIDEIGSAGFFEKNEILAKIGNEIFLKNALLNTYDLAGAVQLVSLPVYPNATVTETLTAFPWNGQMGGVLAIEVENTLTLEASIDVSGAGFRGGQTSVVNSNCNFLTNADAFYYDEDDWRGAPKGEGIANTVPNKEHGRGPLANGGGGGNDHNAGGGGGAQATRAGQGGRQKADSAFGCDGDHPGRGGKETPDVPGRIFLGGGGGSGHIDDDGAGSAGANGGGIVILLAGTIEGNGHAIRANGNTPPQASGDGAGGGGGGGTILLDVEEVSGDLFIEAKGGNGGNVSNSSSRCFGPGGGGSGGRLVSGPVNLAGSDLSGGQPGVNTVASGQCDGPSNGANPGEDGVQHPFFTIPVSQDSIVPVAATMQPVPAIGCEGGQVSFEFLVQGNYLEYQWQVNDGSSWANLNNSSVYAGTKTSILTLFNPTVALDGLEYRCVVNSPCVTDLFSETVTLSLGAEPVANFTFNSLGNGTIEFFNNSQFANSYLWDFGDGETGTEQNPTHVFASFGTFTVTLTTTGDCGTDVFTQQITVATAPGADFTLDLESGCAPLTVQFSDLSTDNTESWQWLFPGGNPGASTSQNTSVTYDESGSYNVTLIVTNTEGSDTLTLAQLVTVEDVPAVNFDFETTDLSVEFTNLTLNAPGGYLWDFGDGETSAGVAPTHVYQTQGFFEVTLTAFNDCGAATLTQTVATGALPLAGFSAQTEGGCHPLTVQFENESAGLNLNGYLWNFPGGDPSTSTDENPVVTYSQPGVYDVTLTVSNALGNHTATKTNFITVEATPQAAFFFEIDSLTVSFANTSVGGTYFAWDFGDGSTSTLVNPSHTYTGNGVYTVTLTVANNSCGSAVAYQLFINVTGTNERPALPPAVVFPNPATDFLKVELAEKPQAAMSARLWDLQGKLHRQIELSDRQTTLDCSRLLPGMYFLELRSGSESVRFKVVKN